MVPLLGLAGEVGELLSEYKKHLRDGDAHELFLPLVREELGDILWYLAAASQRFAFSLEDVATANLAKCRDAWSSERFTSSVVGRYDSDFPLTQQFPERFVVRFEEICENNVVRVRVTSNGIQLGDPLTDNAHHADGYRFHDVFHFGLAAGLGWSPVSRKNLRLKRRCNAKTDEVEDGGRAAVIEEGIAALIFSYAIEHDWLREVDRVDHDILKAVKKMTSHLEVASCTLAEWESTVLMLCPVWHKVIEERGGKIEVDLMERTLRYLGW